MNGLIHVDHLHHLRIHCPNDFLHRPSLSTCWVVVVLPLQQLLLGHLANKLVGALEVEHDDVEEKQDAGDDED